jgi:Glycosyl transferase 4-like domain
MNLPEELSHAWADGTSVPRAGRVLFVSYDFPPCARIGAFSCAQIARYLPSYGWDPIVLSVREQYYEMRDHRLEVPAQVIRTRVLPHPLALYHRARMSGHDDGTPESFRDTRPAPGGDARGMAAARDVIVSLLDLPDIYAGWIPPAVIAGIHATRRLGATRLLSSGPWWTNHIVGLLLARLTRLPWIAHFRDPWTHSPGWDQESPFRRRLRAALERRVVTRADAVVCVTEQHTNLLRAHYPDLARGKFTTIPNGYDEAEWSGITCRDKAGGAPSEFVVAYAGTLDDDRTPEPLFKAARGLIDQGELDGGHLRFDFVGHCDTAQGRRLVDIAAEWGLEKCLRLRGVLSKAETLAVVVRSDLLLLLAEGWPLQIPAKTYEYLRAGLPILALAPPDGAVAALMAATGGAWVVDPSNESGIRSALRDAYRGWRQGQPTQRPDPAAVARFDRAGLVGELASVLSRIGPQHR